jgi:predicted MPP superfamily phosphohydrolase
MRLPRLTRRRFFRLLGAGTVGTLIYTWRIEPHRLEVVERELPIANLPPSLEGKKLVQISDLHIGDLVDDDYISEAIRHACSLADLLVITGDFMSGESGEQIDKVVRILEGNLRHPPLGTIGILGNHDYGHTWKNHNVADRLAERLRGLGITLLQNQIANVAGLQIAGVDDLWSGRFDPDLAMSKIDLSQAALVLCHNPDGADIPGWKDFRGWILSGHTHGGQCKPPFLPPPLLPVVNKRYTSGEFDLDYGRRIYINRGLGYIERVRFNVRPEITVFTLREG